ncbi:MAG TPA: EAL domain-containing protein [Oculatellaceae cyanobacterium]|jgi:diguanylate cyclase (GGDEF)-like protein
MIKILIIEDEEPLRENILALLETDGFDVFGSENGRLGVQLALEILPDLILCDVMMPELDGYGVLTELRENPILAAVPFIFLTAKATKADLRQGMELGADDYLTKPFTRAELLRAITTRLKKQASIQQAYNTKANPATEAPSYFVYYDNLTNLPNRTLLQERLNQILQVNYNQQIPILCIGLDRFQRISDTLGTVVTDLVVRSVAERLTTCVADHDTLARFSNDQFVIVFTTITQKQDIADFSQIILDVLSRPLKVNEQELFITASIGISFYPNNSRDVEILLNQADLAMSQARKQGGNNYQFYTTQLQLLSLAPLSLETDLRYALEREEFEVLYQPQVDMRTGQIVGAEALLRWHHPEKKLISPVEFIPIAEETGLIIPIGEWVLRTACIQTKLWQNGGFENLNIAVNLSVYQFNQKNIIEKVCDILRETGLNPATLELELTESSIVQNPEATRKIFSELKLLGIQISIDDFGTGYSSLSYLQQFPFDTLKVDKCFVRNIANDSKNAAITTAIIQMAHGLKLKVIAEGVETQAEQYFLSQHECDAMQGYLFSRPVPAKEFEKLLIEGKRLGL